MANREAHLPGQDLPVQVLFLSTSDISGGAARAAYRLFQGVQQLDIPSVMWVQSKSGDHEAVIAPNRKLDKGWAALRPSLDEIPQRLLGRMGTLPLSPQWFPDGLSRKIKNLNPQVVHLHWINKGFVRIESLPKFPGRLVWTLHDMWPFTGGCHYSQDCRRYEGQCGACPQMNSQKDNDLSRWVWRRKAGAWRELDLTIVCPSHWMGECASRSSLFRGKRIEVIGYGIDTQHFRPMDRQLARSWLGLPQDKVLVLFSASGGLANPYKGFHLLVEALARLAGRGWGERLELVVMGASGWQGQASLAVKTHFLGFLHDEVSQALVYNAADLFLAPSIQDNLPNTVLEALACGAPCVAFNSGGIPDLVDHELNGYLAKSMDVDDFVHGIEWVLGDTERRKRLGQAARAKVEKDFELVQQAQKYARLYEEILHHAD